jgi:predicted RNase H-like nuclease (RuvC/YqgF family)
VTFAAREKQNRERPGQWEVERDGSAGSRATGKDARADREAGEKGRQVRPEYPENGKLRAHPDTFSLGLCRDTEEQVALGEKRKEIAHLKKRVEDMTKRRNDLQQKLKHFPTDSLRAKVLKDTVVEGVHATALPPQLQEEVSIYGDNLVGGFYKNSSFTTLFCRPYCSG